MSEYLEGGIITAADSEEAASRFGSRTGQISAKAVGSVGSNIGSALATNQIIEKTSGETVITTLTTASLAGAGVGNSYDDFQENADKLGKIGREEIDSMKDAPREILRTVPIWNFWKNIYGGYTTSWI